MLHCPPAGWKKRSRGRDRNRGLQVSYFELVQSFPFFEILHLSFLFSYCKFLSSCNDSFFNLLQWFLFWAPAFFPFLTSRIFSFLELLQLSVLIPKFSRFMLEQNLAKTMLEFQELMTVFQVTIMIMILIWTIRWILSPRNMIIIWTIQWILSWLELANEYDHDVSASPLERQPQGNERAAV